MAHSLAAALPDKPPKVSPPRLHEGVVSCGLQERLTHASKSGGVWVYAGPGSGKTQGVRKWLEERSIPFAWFQVDGNDLDANRVMYYLQHAVSALPISGPGLTPFNPAVHADLRRFTRHWCEQLDTSLRENCVLVLDDLHLLGTRLHEHPVFAPLLHRSFERLRVVVISRASPESLDFLPKAYFSALGPESCALEISEIRELLVARGVSASKLSDEQLGRIAESSARWVAALRLIRELPGEKFDPADESSEPSYDQLVYRLIQSELLDPLPAVQQKTLRVLSYVSAFSTEMIDALDPSGQTRATILRYCHENRFVDVLERSEPPSLRFHALFRESLQRADAHETPSGIDRETATALIQMALDEQRFGDALELMIRLGDWDGFVQWISYSGLVLLERGERQTLRMLLDRLPEDVWAQEQSPRLLLLHGASMVYSHSSRAMSLLGRALELCQLQGGTELDLALILCCGGEAVLGAGEHSLRLEPFWRALEVKTPIGFHGHVPPVLELRIAVMANLMIMICDPLSSQSDLWATELVQLASQVDPGTGEAESLGLHLSILIMMWASHGYAEKTHAIIPSFMRISGMGSSVVSTMSRAMVDYSIALAQGRFPDAFEIYDNGHQMGERIGSSMWRVSMVGMTAAIASSVQDISRVRSMLRDAEQSIDRRDGVGLFNRAMMAATLEAYRGNAPECLRELSLARDMVDESGHRMMSISARCALCAVYSDLGEFEQAQRMCNETQAIAEMHGLRVAHWAHWAASAYLDLRQDALHSCLGKLRRLIAELREAGYYAFPTSWVGSFGELLCVALEHDIETDYVRDLIVRNERYGDARPHPKWPAKYRLQCLGGCSFMIDEQEGLDGFRPANGHYELIMTLLWLGGRDVADHRLMALLWPEKPSHHKNPLHQVLKRVRQALGRSQAIVYDSGRLSLHPGMWQVDLWELESQLEALVERCLSLERVDEAQKRELQSEYQRLRSSCDGGFLTPASLPRSLCGVEEAMGAKLMPQSLARALQAAEDAVSRI